MILRFYKYQGTGNDFILIDNRSFVLRNHIDYTNIIANLCNRRFGIGADGLILINKSDEADFAMQYFNSDGKEGTMCGNGGRCSVAFVNYLGIIKEKTTFIAIDGLHEAIICNKEKDTTLVSLKMKEINNVEKYDQGYILDTGSPHYVCFKENAESIDVYNEGKKIRNNTKFFKKGVNVDFATIYKDYIYVRTYERGVEAETLSCGTGAVATAIAASISDNENKNNEFTLITKGGKLYVHFDKISKTLFTDIWLKGNVTNVFKGDINI
ncbi:MAG: diaminopimelate epimerase [Bacteroidetes bacterium]|nr:diaminopimelate epimerase [Bacteroidota bacterium]